MMNETLATPECTGEAFNLTRNSESDEVNIQNCDDQSACELFDSFMEIANDPSLQDESESELTKMSGKSASEGTEECNEKSQTDDLASEDENGKGINHCEQDVSSAASSHCSGCGANKEEHGSRKGEPENKRESNARLSKAVDDLDGLQQQLSSMMITLKASDVPEEKNMDTTGMSKPEAENSEHDVSEQKITEEMKTADNLVCSEGEQINEDDEERVSPPAAVEVQESATETEAINLPGGNMTENVVEFPASGNNHQNCEHNEEESVQMHPQAVEENTVGISEVECCKDGVPTEQSTESIEEASNESKGEEQGFCSVDGENGDSNKTPLESLSAEISQPTCVVQGPSEGPEENSSTDNSAMMPAGCNITPPLDGTVPEIEIKTPDEQISNSERKSLDSLDMEQSSHSSSQPGSPSQSDEGIDSDTRSDCGDEDTSFLDPESLQRSRPKSWYLEIASRDSIHSDSSLEGDSKSGGKSSKATSLGEVLIRGHLLKMGGSGLRPKNWRKRWFVLKKDNCLYYYKQSKDTNSLGVIVLANYSISKAVEMNKKFCFRLSKGGARTYYLCAADETDMRKWMMSLNRALKEAAEAGNNSFQISESNVHNVSIPALSIRDPDCHGYLSKLGQGKVKTWKRRYCVLKNGYLYYYTDMSNATALGVAKLLGYELQNGEQQGKRFCFSAIAPEDSQRTYFFAADSEGERKRWMRRLEFSIKKGGGQAEDE